MSFADDTLYLSLPAIIRERDLERGEPLRALLCVLAREGRLVEEDLQRLYDNLFIETCDEWVVPYIGDLLGVRGLHDTGAAGFSQRARVANTLAYRRRKGTATMLEQLALDVTGWRARALECFELLSATQWLNHLRPHAPATADLRNGDRLELTDTAFETSRHLVDVRRIASGRGRYNLPNLALFLWRLQSYPLAEFDAPAATDGGAAVAARGRFHVHPLGRDVPLFNPPSTENEIATLATEREVPGALRRRPLDAETQALRRGTTVPSTPEPWLAGEQPVFRVRYRLTPAGPWVNVPPEEIVIADLTAAPVPELWLRPAGTPAEPLALALDPVLGRIAFPAGTVPSAVRVSAAHAFPGDVGGGAYDRRSSMADFGAGASPWIAVVGRDLTADPANRRFNTLATALAAWQAAAVAEAIVALTDSGTYAEGALSVPLATGQRLLLVAATWSPPPAAAPAPPAARELSPLGIRPLITGSLAVHAAERSELWLDGLWLNGALTVDNAGGKGLASLRLAHTTLVPGAGGLAVADAHDDLRIALERCICGAITLAAGVESLAIAQSAVDAAGAAVAIAAGDNALDVQASTIVGTVEAGVLDASNALFTATLTARRRQLGCVRFSFVPEGSQTSRRYRCQPDLALAEVDGDPAAEAQVLARIVPDFTHEAFPQPAYLQLARSVPLELRTGADDGAEMGVWHFLRQPQREANLRASLDEYLRLGLEAGLVFVT